MFHVPELARNTTHPQLGSTARDGNNGVFDVESPVPGWRLALICSDGTEAPDRADWQWEHVSVHAYRARARRDIQTRTPTWTEMAFIKNLCWDAEDTVMQLHPRRSEYVNSHPHVLHLWRPTRAEIPTPPHELVGVLS